MASLCKSHPKPIVAPLLVFGLESGFETEEGKRTP
jgi:hypothetical protein